MISEVARLDEYYDDAPPPGQRLLPVTDAVVGDTPKDGLLVRRADDGNW